MFQFKSSFNLHENKSYNISNYSRQVEASVTFLGKEEKTFSCVIFTCPQIGLFCHLCVCVGEGGTTISLTQFFLTV